MMNSYRRLVFVSFNRLSNEEYKRIKSYLKNENLIPDELNNPSVPVIAVCSHLESIGLVNDHDVHLYITLFRLVNREELANDMIDYQSQFSRFALTQKRIESLFVFGNRKLSIVSYSVIFFAVTLYGPSVVQEIFKNKTTGLGFCMVSILLVYYKYEDIRDYFRYVRCTYGCIPDSVMSFEFTGMNLATSSVVDNVEFTWPMIHKKFPYLTKHPDNMHYFLNTNRCILGGVRSVATENKPAVRGAEVIAVPEDGGSVWYFDDKNRMWKRYQSAKHIQWNKAKLFAME